jgi:hypothetical protein
MNLPPNSGIGIIVIYTQISYRHHTVYAIANIALCNIREEFGVTKAPPPQSTTPAQ